MTILSIRRGPSEPIKKKYMYLPRILLGQEGAKYASASKNPAATGVLGPDWGHLGCLWVTFGHFGHLRIALKSLWSHFGCMRVRFQNTLIFPTDLNHFYKTTEWILDRFGITLASLFAYEAAFGFTLGSLWGHLGHIDVEFHT